MHSMPRSGCVRDAGVPKNVLCLLEDSCHHTAADAACTPPRDTLFHSSAFVNLRPSGSIAPGSAISCTFLRCAKRSKPFIPCSLFTLSCRVFKFMCPERPGFKLKMQNSCTCAAPPFFCLKCPSVQSRTLKASFAVTVRTCATSCDNKRQARHCCCRFSHKQRHWHTGYILFMCRTC